MMVRLEMSFRLKHGEKMDSNNPAKQESTISRQKWIPAEIIIHESVQDDPVTGNVLAYCPDTPVKIVSKATPDVVKQASDVLRSAGSGMLKGIMAGKKVLFVAPAGNGIVDKFTMPDDRILCPHFDRIKFAFNGCFYRCEWCYLKLTYRDKQPYITIRAEHDKIKKQLQKRISKSSHPVMFNSGELADSLSMEHLTMFGRDFIPWFGRKENRNGHLFMLTKSDNVDAILDLRHNNHTVIAWSMNNAEVSRKFEIGAPSFARRLKAAEKVQKAGYPVRIRLDPIVPVNGWKAAYGDTIRQIFETVQPERVTLGTLRFEKPLYHMMCKSTLTSNQELQKYLEIMQPMFTPKMFPGKKRPTAGKYSFPEAQRTEIFAWAMAEIRKYSDCKIALCKESADIWTHVGLEPSRCSCVCQLEYADMG